MKKLLDSRTFSEWDLKRRSELKVEYRKLDKDGTYLFLLPEDVTGEDYDLFRDAIEGLDLNAIVASGTSKITVISLVEA